MSKSYRAWRALAGLLVLLLPSPRMLPRDNPSPPVVDPAMARTGEMLFKHEWQPNDPLAAGGDGLGPVFNATSCVACHHQAGPGGGGGLEHNVTTFTALHPPLRSGDVASDMMVERREGVVHAYGVGVQETLKDVHPELPPVARLPLDQFLPAGGPGVLYFPRGVHLSQRNTPALFGARLIDELPEAVIGAGEQQQRLKQARPRQDGEEVPVGRSLLVAGGRKGRFGWKGQTRSLSEFVQAACASELGLGNPGHPQPRPLGQPDYPEGGLDLTLVQCAQLTAFVKSLPRPVERLPESAAVRADAARGKQLFNSTGCADCHTPKLGPIEGLYSDLLLHDMGKELEGGGAPYGRSEGETPKPEEWRTPPLWGVADSAPYLHDGRAGTLQDAIRLHGGQAKRAAQHFTRLPDEEQSRLIAFLKTLRAP